MDERKKLPASQLLALLAIHEVGGKSGKFYADLGHRATTLATLERKGLIRAVEPWSIIGRPIYGRTWVSTVVPAGSLPSPFTPDRR